MLDLSAFRLQPWFTLFPLLWMGLGKVTLPGSGISNPPIAETAMLLQLFGEA